MELYRDKKFQVNPACCRNLVSFAYCSLWIGQISTRTFQCMHFTFRNPTPSSDIGLWFSKSLQDYVSPFQNTSSCPRYPTNLFDEWLLILMYGTGVQTFRHSDAAPAFVQNWKKRQEWEMSVNVLLKSVVKLALMSALFSATVQCKGRRVSFRPHRRHTWFHSSNPSVLVVSGWWAVSGAPPQLE